MTAQDLPGLAIDDQFAKAVGAPVDDLARVPLSFPTYAGVLGRVAATVSRQLNLNVNPVRIL